MTFPLQELHKKNHFMQHSSRNRNPYILHQHTHEPSQPSQIHLIRSRLYGSFRRGKSSSIFLVLKPMMGCRVVHKMYYLYLQLSIKDNCGPLAYLAKCNTNSKISIRSFHKVDEIGNNALLHENKKNPGTKCYPE